MTIPMLSTEFWRGRAPMIVGDDGMSRYCQAGDRLTSYCRRLGLPMFQDGESKKWVDEWVYLIYTFMPPGKELAALRASMKSEEVRRALLTLIGAHVAAEGSVFTLLEIPEWAQDLTDESDVPTSET